MVSCPTLRFDAILAVAGIVALIASCQSANVPSESPPVFTNDYTPTAEDYDPVAARLRETGTVVLSVLVGSDGHCKEARIVQSASTLLDNSAIRLCQEKLTWEPALQNGTPVEAWTTRRVKFELGPKPSSE